MTGRIGFGNPEDPSRPHRPPGQSLRACLAGKGSPLVGTFVVVPRIEVVELLTYAGFDVLILDCEHGPYGVETLPALVAAVHGAGAACLVRVPAVDPQVIGAALDVGADGVLVPQVQSAEVAANAVRAARFSPEGERGANPYIRAAAYSSNPNYFAEANERVACLVMVEGREGIAAVDAILGVPGVDAVFLGPVDISMALDVPGEPEHPLVVEAVSGVVQKAREHGVATGVFAPNPEAANRWFSVGVRLVALSVDTALMLQGFSTALGSLRLDETSDACSGEAG